jgi:lipocalin
MDSTSKKCSNTMDILRYKGKWYKVTPKAYEPERQTAEVAWLQMREPITSQDAYRKFYEKQRSDAKILYPSFRKDDN